MDEGNIGGGRKTKRMDLGEMNEGSPDRRRYRPGLLPSLYPHLVPFKSTRCQYLRPRASTPPLNRHPATATAGLPPSAIPSPRTPLRDVLPLTSSRAIERREEKGGILADRRKVIDSPEGTSSWTDKGRIPGGFNLAKRTSETGKSLHKGRTHLPNSVSDDGAMLMTSNSKPKSNPNTRRHHDNRIHTVNSDNLHHRTFILRQ
jgi:hypothetical protein